MPTPNYTLEGHVIRPPAEANSVILQATIGCPHNKCHFCGTYRKVSYQIRNASDFEKHVKSSLQAYPKNAKRFFFADGDIASLPTKTLLEDIKIVLKYFPDASRFACYARAEGKFQKLTDTQSLQETRAILKEIKDVRSVFRADHASNPLPLSGTLPRDRDKLINQIDVALKA